MRQLWLVISLYTTVTSVLQISAVIGNANMLEYEAVQYLTVLVLLTEAPRVVVVIPAKLHLSLFYLPWEVWRGRGIVLVY